MPFDAANFAPYGYTMHGKPRVRPSRAGEGASNRRIYPPEIAADARRLRAMIGQRLMRARLRGASDKPPRRRHDWSDAPIALLCCELLIERHIRRQRRNEIQGSGD